jgi:hypothetical protein
LAQILSLFKTTFGKGCAKQLNVDFGSTLPLFKITFQKSGAKQPLAKFVPNN